MKQADLLPPGEALPCGQPDSALEISELRHENEELKKRLEEVVETAAKNEKIWRHFAEIERILFRTRELDRLIEELLKEIKARFQPDQVVLLLCHPEILERFYPDSSCQSEPIGEGTWVLPFPIEAAYSVCTDTPKTILFFSEEIKHLLGFLPKTSSSIRSGVLVPLCVHQILFGCLFLGSADAAHYNPEDGTDLLEQLATKIALCMDNCLAYERVKDFTANDPLTGMLNFFQIHTVLERELRKARRLGRPLSLLILDPDFYHDSDGPSDVGNLILKHIADLLRDIFPEEAGIVGRYGSDEFLIILPNAEEEEAREVIPYLSRTIRKSPFKYGNTVILIQTIIGVATLKDGMERSQDLLDAAYSELCNLKLSHYESKD